MATVTTTEPLSVIDNKTVRGPTFMVQVQSIHKVKYEEGRRSTSVEIEGGPDDAGKIYFSIYADTISGWEPKEFEPISSAEREVIMHFPTNGFLTDRIVASVRRIAPRRGRRSRSTGR